MTDELRRLLRAYIVILLALVCVFSVWAGILVARNNTRKIMFGEAVEIVEFGK